MKRRTKIPKTQADDKVEQTVAQPKTPAPTPEQIQKRAYEIYETRGGAPRREWDDWFLAEIELKSEPGLQRDSPE